MQKKFFLLFGFLYSIQFVFGQVYINEVDADTPSTDVKEFIELKSVTSNFSLNGYVLVLFNGGSTGVSNLSYYAIDLDGYTTDINGIFLIGNSQVSPAPSIVIPNATVQNGPDAIGLYLGNTSDFPTNTAGTSTNLISAVAYSSSTSVSPTTLMSALSISSFQVDNTNNSANISIQRDNNGIYSTAAPTPGQNNDGSGIQLTTITVTPSATTVTEGETISFTYTTSAPVTGSNLIINVSLNNGNFTLLDFNNPLTVYIPVGQSSVTQDFIIIDDTYNEGDEELKLQVQSLQSGYVLNNNNIIVRVNESRYEVQPWGTPANPTYGQVLPTYPADYYNSLNGLSGSALKQALQDIIANPNVVKAHSYADVWEILNTADQNPANSSQVWLIYDEVPRSKLDRQTESSVIGKWNREHIYCQSRGNFGDFYNTPADGINSYLLSNANDIAAGLSDVHHIRAVDGQENSSRNNRNYGVDYNGPTGSTSNTWKGDVARALFYMAVRYNGLNVVNGNPPDNTIGQIGDLASLLQWNQLDPRDDFEMNRNNYIYTWQQNRNPFIDFPLLVEYIWGNHQGEIWNNSLQTSQFNIPNIVVYPNPAKKEIFISGIDSSVLVQVYSLLGQKVEQKELFSNQPISIQHLNKGVYVIKITLPNNQILEKKLIVE